MDSYCSTCQKLKPINDFHADARRSNSLRTSCKECRREAFNAQKYPLACSECDRHRRLDPNGLCGKCNQASGFKYCRKCDSKLLSVLGFYATKNICKACVKALR